MKFFKYLPIPHLRYSIFCGTTTLMEFVYAIRFLIFFPSKEKSKEYLSRYELEFSKKANCKHAISYGAGRMGLYSILKAYDFPEGSEVILPAFSCVVVPNSIIYAGLKPVYVDICKDTFNINTEKIREKITSKTKALYIQHTFGVISDSDKLKKIAEEYNLILIEDSAHALGIKDDQGLSVGNIGHVAFFSTDHSKVISTGFGGMVTTNDDKLAEKLKSDVGKLRELSFLKRKQILACIILEYIIYSPVFFWGMRFARALLNKFGIFNVFSGENVVDLSKLSDYPVSLPPELAYIGLNQIKELENNLEHRAEIVKALEEKLNLGLKQGPLLRYSFLVKDRTHFKEMFLNYELGIWFDSIMQGRNDKWEEIYYKKGSCPVAEYCSEHIVNFPTHNRISRTKLIRQVENKRLAIKNMVEN